MPTNRRKLLLNTVSISLGCVSCRRPKLTQIFNPKPKPKQPRYKKHTLSQFFYDEGFATPATTTATPTTSAATFSPSVDYDDNDYNPKGSKSVHKFSKKIGNETVAVEKDSDDPYLDFRHSMLQMILENEIYSKDDLRELLNCFLQLNSPYHHGIIVRAFTEIWNGVFSVKSSASPKLRFGCKSREF